MGQVKTLPLPGKDQNLPVVTSLHTEKPIKNTDRAWDEFSAVVPVLRWIQTELTYNRNEPSHEGPVDAVLGYIIAMTTNHIDEVVHFKNQARLQQAKEG